MIELIDSVIDVIKRNVLNVKTLSAPANAGDTVITVSSARNFFAGNEIAIYQGETAQIATVCEVEGFTSLRVSPSLTCSFETGAEIQKLHGGQFVRFVLPGDPPTIPQYPAITVNHEGQGMEPAALGGTYAESHQLAVTLYVETANYDCSYRLRQKLTERIKHSLFRSPFLLIAPYFETSLIETTPAEDVFVRLANPSIFYDSPSGDSGFFIVNEERYPRAVTRQGTGSDVFVLNQWIPVEMTPENTRVIRPIHWVYDNMPEQIEYGTTVKGSTTLMDSRIDYRVRIMRNRYSEPLDV